MTAFHPTALRLARSCAIVAILVVWFAIFRPTALGGPAAYVVVAGDSMLPTLRSGDLVVARQGSTYEIGDVIVYRVPVGQPGEGASVIHRVVGGSLQDGLVTRGDNTDAPDLWRPRSADVLGSAWLSIPAVGRVIAFVRSPLGLGAMSGFGVFIVIAMWRPATRSFGVRSWPRGPHG